MKEEYYNEIEHYIKKYEVSKRARVISDNYEQLETNWNIGRLIVEAQGGAKRAKYGNGLIKEWSKKYTENYGKGYTYTNLSRFRQFYLSFPILAPVAQVSWTNILILLPIKDTNKRNYYINLCIEKSLSKRALMKEIKSSSYERLLNKPEHVEIIELRNITSLDKMKNPIILEVSKNEEVKSEKDLQLLILSKLKSFFEQLGNGFALVGNEYKIIYENKNYFIDILLFNYESNQFIVVELKLRKLKKEDKGQIEFYMRVADKVVKKEYHNKTIGIIITKEQDNFIMNFIREENIIPLIYQLKSNISK